MGVIVLGEGFLLIIDEINFQNEVVVRAWFLIRPVGEGLGRGAGCDLISFMGIVIGKDRPGITGEVRDLCDAALVIEILADPLTGVIDKFRSQKQIIVC